MPQSIPKVLTAEHVLRALADLDAGMDHPFGSPTGYELVHQGRRYPPKEVIGLAFHHAGRIRQPEEFSGGEAPGPPVLKPPSPPTLADGDFDRYFDDPPDRMVVSQGHGKPWLSRRGRKVDYARHASTRARPTQRQSRSSKTSQSWVIVVFNCTKSIHTSTCFG